MLKSLREFWQENQILSIMLLAIVFRLLAAIFAKGYAMNDDHFVVIHVAQRWIDGFNDWFDKDHPSGFSLVYTGLHYILFYILKMAGITDPKKEICIAEVDDRFSYKELQHLEALGLVKKGEAGKLAEEGALEVKGSLPTNMSGGALGVGNCLEATGLQKSLEIITQLRGHAAKTQVPDVERGIAQSWRFLPTGSGAVAIFERG